MMREISLILQKINAIRKICEPYAAMLVVVTKNQPRFIVQALLEEGICTLGESRIQNIKEKFTPSQNENLHFLGHIQSKKCKEILTYCTTIHSLDRLDLVEKFAHYEKTEALKREYYIQVNLGEEPQKSGIVEPELECLVEHTKTRLNLIGLMTLPPQHQDPRPYFRTLRKLADTHNLSKCSMGMSHDYQIALDEGSTCIRIGSLLW